MPVASVEGGEKLSAEEVPSHHTLPATKILCHPLEILTGRQAKLKLNIMEKLRCIAVEDTGASTR